MGISRLNDNPEKDAKLQSKFKPFLNRDLVFDDELSKGYSKLPKFDILFSLKVFCVQFFS